MHQPAAVTAAATAAAEAQSTRKEKAAKPVGEAGQQQTEEEKQKRDGDGEAHPKASTSCECHYEGRTAQEYDKEPKGKKFDSSYDRGDPTSFAPDGVIKGWCIGRA